MSADTSRSTRVMTPALWPRFAAAAVLAVALP